MEEVEETAVSGRVLVEPVEFVDLREIVQGKHGSHRGSPDRELPAKSAAKGASPHEDHSYNCLQIALQEQNPVHTNEKEPDILLPGDSFRSEPDSRTPSKDEVLSVVIQKLTELVKNSEKQRKEAPDQVTTEETKSIKNESRGAEKTDRTRLYQCPKCPCLFAVTCARKKDQLCSCCSKNSNSGNYPQAIKDSDQIHCYRDGKDHGGIACDICSVKVNSYNDLLYHLATHDAIKIFRCKFCNFVTTSHATIEDHQEIHLAERVKRCVCSVCGFKTSDFRSLQTHIKIVHQSAEEILLKCSECGYSTKVEASLRSHMWTHVKSENGVQMPRQLSNDINRQTGRSPPRPSSDESMKSVGRKDTKVRANPVEASDPNTKLFKCLLCGYLCEKISTLKAHAWRHAGQEGCSYPVMHRVEDVSEISAQEDAEKEASAIEGGANKFNFVEVSRNVDAVSPVRLESKSGCQCFPIVLPKEEHEIVRKVFADATSVDENPEQTCKVSSTTDATEEDAPSRQDFQQVMPSSVIVKVPHQAKNENCDDGSSKVACRNKDLSKDCDTGKEGIVEYDSDTAKPVLPQPLPHEIEVFEEVVIACESALANDGSSNAHKVDLREKEVDGEIAAEDIKLAAKNEPVKHKHCKKLKRKSASQDIGHAGKKSRTKAGISKLLLNAVDDALQVGVTDEKKESSTNGEQKYPQTPAKVSSVANVLPSPAQSSSEEQYQCPICRQMFPSTIKTHVCNHGSTPIFKCHKCPASFWHLGRLQAHMATHDAILKCSKCPFSCGSEMALRDHVKKAHLPAKSSVCPSCHNEVVEKSPKAHEQSCVLKCWYGCRECDFVASSMDDLLMHGTATHHKPYKCALCDYSSATPNGIKNHMKFHNADKPYKCHLCHFSGAYPQSLRSHMKKHSTSAPGQSNDQYKCKFCSYTSGHLPSMKSHMWRHASNPGYDYDGQDIIKMVVKVSGETSNNNNDKIEAIPERKTAPKSQERKKQKDPQGTDPQGTDPQGEGSPRNKSSAHVKKGKEGGQVRAVPEPPMSKQIQYGSVIFQCSQCGFKSNDHNCLVEHLRGHLSDGE